MSKHLYPFSRNINVTPKNIKSFTEFGFVDVNDNEIIDLGLGSSGCFPLGFKRTDIIESVNERLKEMPFCQSDFNTTTDSVEKLSNKLHELSDGYETIYSMSGSDSIEGAIKLAKLYNPERNTIIGFENSYHGSTFMSASVSGSTYLTDTFGKHPDTKIFNSIEDITETVLAVIIETCSWQNGLISHTDEFWITLRNRCDEFNVLLIIDDIAFCNGKTGSYFGWQILPIKPDVFCIGKGITAGYFPLSATLMNERVANVVRPKVLLHGFAYSFPMSGIHSAIKFLEIIEEEHVLEKHQLVVNEGKQLCEVLKEQKLIKDYRNFGVCFNLLLNKPLQNIADKDELFYRNKLHIGVWNNYKDGILLMLPLTPTDEYFTSLTQRLTATLTELNQQN